jgi:hypothetical protein
LDRLNSQKLAEKLSVASGADPAAPGGATKSALSIDDKALRSSQRNAVTITLSVLQTFGYERISAIIVSNHAPLHAWRTSTCNGLSSVESASDWVRGQLRGDFMEHIFAFMTLKDDVRKLDRCQFLGPMQCDANDIDAHLVREDEFAALYGRMGPRLASARLRRLAWMIIGWPIPLSSILDGEPIASTIIELFKKDKEYIDDLRANWYEVDASLAAVVDRSVFNHMSVEQVLLAFLELGFSRHDEIDALLLHRIRGLLSSLLAEDTSIHPRTS